MLRNNPPYKTSMNPPPSTEERIWAILSHLSALAFGMGILLPILGWSEQRSKSKYASFQCLQALGYQSLGYTAWVLASLLGVVLLSILLLVLLNFREPVGTTPDMFAGMWTGIFVLVMLGLFGVYMVLPVAAAVACGLGRDFRYPVLGNRLARYLGHGPNAESQSLIEEHEERWVAAMGHFSVIIALWGLLAPVTTWILRGRDSAFLKFQSMQTTLYQVFVTLLYVASGAVYLAAVLLLFALFGLSGDTLFSSPAGMAGLLILFVTLLIAALIMLVVPLFHILGQWAGYRLLKGDDYRYPLFGRLVESWLTNKTTLAADGGSSVLKESESS
jgi:uncharacterized Tic20 family protein